MTCIFCNDFEKKYEKIKMWDVILNVTDLLSMLSINFATILERNMKEKIVRCYIECNWSFIHVLNLVGRVHRNSNT